MINYQLQKILKNQKFLKIQNRIKNLEKKLIKIKFNKKLNQQKNQLQKI